jgi:hypothetical protein
MGWTFVYLMLILKLPIAGLLWLVWWAVHQEDTQEEPVVKGDDGGTRKPRPHPRPPLPRRPRRGPHGAPAPAPPARTRTVLARGRRVEH